VLVLVVAGQAGHGGDEVSAEGARGVDGAAVDGHQEQVGHQHRHGDGEHAERASSFDWVVDRGEHVEHQDGRAEALRHEHLAAVEHGGVPLVRREVLVFDVVRAEDDQQDDAAEERTRHLRRGVAHEAVAGDSASQEESETHSAVNMTSRKRTNKLSNNHDRKAERGSNFHDIRSVLGEGGHGTTASKHNEEGQGDKLCDTGSDKLRGVGLFLGPVDVGAQLGHTVIEQRHFGQRNIDLLSGIVLNL